MSYENVVIKNILYKALTRPPMFIGIPLVPFIIVMMFYVLLVVILGNMLFLLGAIPIAIAMKIITSFDDQAFSLIFLKYRFFIKTIVGNKNTNQPIPIGNIMKSKKMFGSFALFPNRYRKNKSQERAPKIDKKNDILDYTGNIPYSSHVHENIIITTSGYLVATFELKGIPYATTNNYTLEKENIFLSDLIKNLSSKGYSLSFHYSRVRDDYKLDFEAHFDNKFANKLYDLYKNFLLGKNFKQQRIFFSIIYDPYPTRVKPSQKQRSDELEAKIEQFQEMLKQADNSLSKMNPRLLGLYENDGVVFSENLAIYQYLITHRYQPVRVGDYPLYEIFGAEKYLFVGDTLEVIDINNNRSYCKCIEIKEYSQDTYQGLFDEIHDQDINFVITHSFSSQDKSASSHIIERQMKQLRSTKDKATSQIDMLSLAMDDLMSGNIIFGKHHFSLVIYADSQKKLSENCATINTKLSNAGFVVTNSDVDFPSQFFAQLPANLEYRARLCLINSINFANMIDMHNNQSGKEKNNCWGNAIMPLQTPTGQPYFLNLHEETNKNDFGLYHLGHCAIIGSSGSGKTVTLNMIINMLQQYSSKDSFPLSTKERFTTVVFDKDWGAKGNILALGGRYFTLKNGEPTGFNPLMLDNTEENVEFVVGLLRSLACINNNKFTDKNAKELYFAVSNVMKESKPLRRNGISRVVDLLLNETESDEKIENSLKERLFNWTARGKYGWIFDNEYDELDLSDDIYNFGFDGTNFLDNKEISGAITSYLLYRTTQLLDGRRLVLVFDEFWKWLGSDEFGKFINDKLKTMRKLNGIFICATQSPSDCLRSEYASAIIEQTATKIFLANNNAQKSEYVPDDNFPNQRTFGCTEKEFKLINKFQSTSRLALVKKQSTANYFSSSTVVKTDLSAVSKYLPILSTDINSSNLLDKMSEEIRTDPNWIEVFLERVKS